MQKYLHMENNDFGFYFESIHDIDKEKDIEITDEDYNTFFENQSNGTQYRLKEKRPSDNSGGLFDYVEEYVQEQHQDGNIEPTQEERLNSLEAIINDFILDMKGGDING